MIAPTAKFRETLIDFTDVSKEELELRLGSRDLSMIFNEVPGAYASIVGGGAGDCGAGSFGALVLVIVVLDILVLLVMLQLVLTIVMVHHGDGECGGFGGKL